MIGRGKAALTSQCSLASQIISDYSYKKEKGETKDLRNYNYNLIETISIISKSLHRYDTYIKDASGCKPCQDTWKKIRKEREKELSILLKELKGHVEKGELSA